MEAYPDDSLLAVMQYLDMKALLVCRLVCKRISGLAAHPDVWRHRTLSYANPLGCQVLRLAPCLDILYAELPTSECRQSAYTSTRCAVEELKVLLLGSGDDAVQAADIIRHQEALGRLKRVDLVSASTDAALLAPLASTTGLEKLEVAVLPFAPTPSHTAAAYQSSAVAAASLRHFECTLCPRTEAFTNVILAGHAATLDKVHLGDSPLCMGLTSVMPLLAGLPHLRELTCSSLPGLEALAGCASLRVLELIVQTSPQFRPAAARAARLLREAKQLREVELIYSPPAAVPGDVGVDLVLALASSGVEKLTVNNFGDEYTIHHLPQLRPLISTLPSLRALQYLQAGVKEADELLLSITPRTAPALLCVSLSGLSDKKCAHAWIHGDTLKTVTSSNPSLHLKLQQFNVYCARKSCAKACAAGCHKELRYCLMTKGVGFIGLFSHGAGKKCAVDHSAECHWIQVPLQ